MKLWSIRSRLAVTHILLGAIPTLLVVTLGLLALYIVLGQLAVYTVMQTLYERRAQLVAAATAIVQSTEASQISPLAEGILQAQFPSLKLTPMSADTEETAPICTSYFIIKNNQVYLSACATSPNKRVHLTVPLTAAFVANLLPSGMYANITEFGSGRRSRVSILSSAPFRTRRTSLHNLSVFGYYVLSIPIVADMQARDTMRVIVMATSPMEDLATSLFTSGANSEMRQNDLLSLFGVIAALLLVSELFAIAAALSMSRAIVRSVQGLYTLATRVQSGDMSYRIPVSGKDQLAELNSSFNSMSDHLLELLQNTKEQQRLQTELSFSREVQDYLMPGDLPQAAELDVGVVFEPARSVSGDFYDINCCKDGSITIGMGDVSGKGIGAALLSASIQAAIRTEIVNRSEVQSSCNSGSILTRVNQLVYETTSPGIYASVLLSFYNNSTETLEYTNAGHLPPILVRGGEAIQLETTGVILGAFPRIVYTSHFVRLGPGDTLVMFTDGVTEAENEFGEQFGAQQLELLLKQRSQGSKAQDVADAILAAIREWTSGAEMGDDVTLLVVTRNRIA